MQCLMADVALWVAVGCSLNAWCLCNVCTAALIGTAVVAMYTTHMVCPADWQHMCKYLIRMWWACCYITVLRLFYCSCCTMQIESSGDQTLPQCPSTTGGQARSTPTHKVKQLRRSSNAPSPLTLCCTKPTTAAGRMLRSTCTRQWSNAEPAVHSKCCPAEYHCSSVLSRMALHHTCTFKMRRGQLKLSIWTCKRERRLTAGCLGVDWQLWQPVRWP